MNKKVSLLASILVIVAVLGMGALVTYHQSGGDLIYVDKTAEPGAVFFVSSVTGSDYASCGRSPRLACGTIDYAVGLCTADKGDVIYVMPNHNEGLGASGHIAFDVAGITVIGIGYGGERPRIDYDSAAASVTVDAANVTLKNLTFLPSVTATLIGIDVTASHVTLDGLEFLPGEDGSGVDEFVKDVQVEVGANDFKMVNCVERGQTGAAQQTYAVYLGNAGTIARPVISNNVFWGNYSTAVIGDGSTAITGAVIDHNIWRNATGTIAPVSLETASTSEIFGNDRDAGTTFYTVTTVAAGASIATGGLAVTGASVGVLELIDATIQVGSTSLASANGTAAAELYSNNAKGYGTFFHVLQSSLVAGSMVSLPAYSFTMAGALSGTTTINLTTQTKTVYGRTMILESGKVISIKGDTQTFNAGGTFNVYLVWRRLTPGATIASR